jgi:2',3'-cyclic-nucleotide 3'-phosphodiesterase
MHIRPPQSTSPNSYPRFDPHITLGSASTHEEARAGLPPSDKRTPIPVRFREAVAGPVYFRSVYIAIHQDEAIMKLEEEVRKGLGRSEPPPSYPHMSFAYIDDSESGERTRLLEEYTQKGIFTVGGEAQVALDCGESCVLKNFVSSEIWIVECNGPVEGWKVLEKVSLDGHM